MLSASWGEPHDERAFTARTLAGGLSRLGPVELLVPGGNKGAGAPAVPGRPDGAFDLRGVGGPRSAGARGAGRRDPNRWPDAGTALWPLPLSRRPPGLVVVEDGDTGALDLARRFLDGVPVAAITSCPATRPSDGSIPPPSPTRTFAVGLGGDRGDPARIGLHVPVHPMAASQRHVGLGFTGYLLVLGDRGPVAAGAEQPSDLVAWLAARFADRHIVVVENAVASVWRSRSLRGLVAVSSRTDLWRLVAHARAVVDLSPGPLMARECVESLRYGVPIVVPASTAGERLAAGGGGIWYRDEAELFGCVEALDDPGVREGLGRQGQAVAEEWYGDPDRFVERLRSHLGAASDSGHRDPAS